MSNNNYFSHQDLKPLIIKGKKFHEDKKKKEIATKNKIGEKDIKMIKIDNETEAQKIVKIDSKISNAIMKGRADKKMTRKVLANRMNVNIKIVEEYETCKAIPNINIIKKFERILGIKLTGKEFKKT